MLPCAQMRFIEVNCPASNRTRIVSIGLVRMPLLSGVQMNSIQNASRFALHLNILTIDENRRLNFRKKEKEEEDRTK